VAPVGVEVGGGQAERTGADRDRPLRGEASARVAQEHVDGVRPEHGDREVGIAVAVEVGRLDALRRGPDWDRRGLRREAVVGGIAQEHGDRAAVEVGDGDIRLPVAVEVGGHDVARRGAGGVGGTLLGEAAAPVAEVGDHVGVAVARGGDVRAPVAVEVGGRDRARAADAQLRAGGEATDGLAEHDAHGAGAEVLGGDVGEAVPVEVGDEAVAGSAPDRERRARLGREAGGAAEEDGEVAPGAVLVGMFVV
jgi:hypothetical protein